MQKIILAYSGGLDTSCCLLWLREQGFAVITYTADLGQGLNFTRLRRQAQRCGASGVYIQDVRKRFIRDFVFPALQAGAIYEARYPLATALGRPLIAEGLVETAHKERARYIAHGSTGKGNDQVRIEVSVKALDKRLRIIAPLREWPLSTREEEINYARAHHLEVAATPQKPYSVDVNLWGRSIECGVLEDPSRQPPEEIYQLTRNPRQCADRPVYLTLEFTQGIPVKLNGKRLDAVSLVNRLNKLAGARGVGRIDMVENRLVGIKSREIYEAPAAAVLHFAHRELEDLVLDQQTSRFKRIVAEKYAQLVYTGLWHTPLKSALDKFVQHIQQKVSGVVKLKLYKGNIICAGRSSPFSLYKRELATYNKGDQFDRRAASGFIKIWGLPYER